jgi:hypothetical protein
MELAAEGGIGDVSPEDHYATQLRLARLQEENRTFRKALEFYADSANWEESGPEPGELDGIVAVNFDKGAIARTVLFTPERVTHGRHCPCSACAQEDWTNPKLAHCGMHGPSCPPVYAPISQDLSRAAEGVRDQEASRAS